MASLQLSRKLITLRFYRDFHRKAVLLSLILAIFFDYTQLVSRERIIDRTIPIEALFLSGNIHLQAVISYMSTAVQSCPAVQKIITKPGLLIPGIENWNIEIGD